MNLSAPQDAFVPTSADVCLLEQLLGQAPSDLFSGIQGTGADRQVLGALVLCARALSALDGVDSTQLEKYLLNNYLEAVEAEAVTMIRDITSETNHCVAKLIQLFPPPENHRRTHEPVGDFDFDFFDDASTDAANDVSPMDECAGPDPKVEIALAIGMLSSMLRDDNARFARRLRAGTDRWVLVGELQEFQSRCSKCIQAIVTSCLGACGHTEITETSLPRYKELGRRAAELRASIVRLEEQLVALAQSLQENPDDVEAHRRACLRLIEQKMSSGVWNDMPVVEKRDFVNFHAELSNREKVCYSGLERGLEGFMRFLELLRSNVQSREVREHDAELIRSVLEDIGEGAEPCERLRKAELLFGADEELDGLLRACETGLPCPDGERVESVLQRILSDKTMMF